MKRYRGNDLRKVDVIDFKASGMCKITMGMTFVVYSYDTDDVDKNGYRIMEHSLFKDKFTEVENYNEDRR